MYYLDGFLERSRQAKWVRYLPYRKPFKARDESWVMIARAEKCWSKDKGYYFDKPIGIKLEFLYNWFHLVTGKYDKRRWSLNEAKACLLDEEYVHLHKDNHNGFVFKSRSVIFALVQTDGYYMLFVVTDHTSLQPVLAEIAELDRRILKYRQAIEAKEEEARIAALAVNEDEEARLVTLIAKANPNG
jgi:hypothetical protein